MADALTLVLYDRMGPWMRELRKHANDSRPAYAMSVLCAMSMPFGFGTALKTTSKNMAKVPRLIPPFWQLLGFSVFFGTGAYMIDHGDILNGSGVITGEYTNPSLTRSVVFDVCHIQHAPPHSPVRALASGVAPQHSDWRDRSWGVRKLLL